MRPLQIMDFTPNTVAIGTHVISNIVLIDRATLAPSPINSEMLVNNANSGRKEVLASDDMCPNVQIMRALRQTVIGYTHPQNSRFKNVICKALRQRKVHQQNWQG